MLSRLMARAAPMETRAGSAPAIGDHATNIAETVHYVITGDVLAVERPKADESSVIEPTLRFPST